MRNKIIIGIIVLLVIFMLVVRYLFRSGFNTFKEDIANFEIQLYDEFSKAKKNKLDSLQNDAKLLEKFNELFNDSLAISKKDTSFSILYLSEVLQFQLYSIAFIDCVEHCALIELRNEKVNNEIKKKERYYKRKFGSVFEEWYDNFKEDKLIDKLYDSTNCDKYYPKFQKYQLIRKPGLSSKGF
jgi:hypothetical protein